MPNLVEVSYNFSKKSTAHPHNEHFDITQRECILKLLYMNEIFLHVFSKNYIENIVTH